MPYQRHQRMESLIQSELNKIILRALEFEGALVTVTGVTVQKDLDYAEILVSVMPNEKGAEILKQFEKNRALLKHLLLKKINIKPMPELRFKLDLGMEKAAEVEKALIEIERKGKNG